MVVFDVMDLINTDSFVGLDDSHVEILHHLFILCGDRYETFHVYLETCKDLVIGTGTQEVISRCDNQYDFIAFIVDKQCRFWRTHVKTEVLQHILEQEVPTPSCILSSLDAIESLQNLLAVGGLVNLYVRVCFPEPI